VPQDCARRNFGARKSKGHANADTQICGVFENHGRRSCDLGRRWRINCAHEEIRLVLAWGALEDEVRFVGVGRRWTWRWRRR